VDFKLGHYRPPTEFVVCSPGSVPSSGWKHAPEGTGFAPTLLPRSGRGGRRCGANAACGITDAMPNSG
jgi:hypothetical protein